MTTYVFKRISKTTLRILPGEKRVGVKSRAKLNQGWLKLAHLPRVLHQVTPASPFLKQTSGCFGRQKGGMLYLAKSNMPLDFTADTINYA